MDEQNKTRIEKVNKLNLRRIGFFCLGHSSFPGRMLVRVAVKLFLWLALLLFFPLYINAETIGTASWYSTKSCQREGTSGVWTASGERFNDNGLTCAMRSRDFGKYYKVTNLANNKSIIVKHNDFGPNKKLAAEGRVIDLSKAAFAKIADLKVGLIKVEVKPYKQEGAK